MKHVFFISSFPVLCKNIKTSSSRTSGDSMVALFQEFPSLCVCVCVSVFPSTVEAPGPRETHSCRVQSDTMFCWGGLSSSQLGNRTSGSSTAGPPRSDGESRGVRRSLFLSLANTGGTGTAATCTTVVFVAVVHSEQKWRCFKELPQIVSLNIVRIRFDSIFSFIML